jgi:hypothetical protein
MLAYVEWEGMDDVDVHSSECIRKLVYVDDKVVSSGAFAPVKGALFAKKVCDLSARRRKILDLVR